MGAFEFTPPRGNKSSTRTDSEEQQQPGTPGTPEMPSFATMDALVTLDPQSPTAQRGAADVVKSPSSASHRKRKRMEGSAIKAAYPKTHYPVNPVTASPAGMSSPSWRSPGKAFSNMRRKFSTGGDYLTPTKFRELETRASIEAGVVRASQNLMEDEEPVTPPLDLASPLLRTQLKAMTPHTPLSNRLVGANLDIGSMSQESKLQDYDDSFNAGEPAPQFEIALFPAAFQVRLQYWIWSICMCTNSCRDFDCSEGLAPCRSRPSTASSRDSTTPACPLSYVADYLCGELCAYAHCFVVSNTATVWCL